MKHQHIFARMALLREIVARIESAQRRSQRDRETREDCLRELDRIAFARPRNAIGRADHVTVVAFNKYANTTERNAARRVRALWARVPGPRPPTPAEGQVAREARRAARKAAQLARKAIRAARSA